MISVSQRKTQEQCGNLLLEVFFQFPPVSGCTCPEARKCQLILFIFLNVTVEDLTVHSELPYRIHTFIKRYVDSTVD